MLIFRFSSGDAGPLTRRASTDRVVGLQDDLIASSVLGPFRLEADAEIALPSRKAQALLAYLALSAGRPHRRDKLASLLWADRGDTAARHNLRQALSSIAKAIRPASTDAAAMITNADRIAVDPAAFDVDAARLEGLVADASPEALLEAVKLCHGDLLDGLNLQAEPFEEWLTAQRSRFANWRSRPTGCCSSIRSPVTVMKRPS